MTTCYKERKFHTRIVVEGLDGCGKTTAVELAQKALLKLGYPVMVHHDPDTRLPIGRSVKDIWAASNYEIDEIMHLLFAAGSLEAQLNAEDYHNDSPGIIISDRSPLSTYAYLLHLEPERFFDLHQGYSWPSWIIMLSAPEDILEVRIAERALSGSKSRDRPPDKAILERYAFVLSLMAERGVRIRSLCSSGEIDADAIAAEVVRIAVLAWSENTEEMT